MPLEKLEEELEDTELVKKEYREKKEVMDQKEIIAKTVKFTDEARKQYGEIIKSVLIFGSAVKGTLVKGSDIDLWVILDDTATKASEDLNKVIDHLYLISHELKDLHIQVHTLTEFWQSIRLGSPEFVNFLRYGLAIYDTGFIKPIQRMLQLGLIPPSEETIALKSRTAEVRYRKIKIDLKSMIFELRYTVLDICQAVIMHYYKQQPDYKQTPEFLEKLVKQKKLERTYIKKYEELDDLWKAIDHKEIKEVTTQHLQRALDITRELIDRMKKLLPSEYVGEELPEV